MTIVLRILLTAFIVAGVPAARAAPLLFHDHGHGLAFSSDGKALLAPSHGGLSVYRDGTWSEVSGQIRGFSGFSVAEHAIYSSGHARPGVPVKDAVGLLRSRDGGRNWTALAPALAGKADFRFLAAGYRSKAIYVFNAQLSAVMPERGLYVTLDEGRVWRRAAARGLEDEIHGISAHPTRADVVAIATGRGLYFSRDGGNSFARLDRRGPVTAVAFDFDGRRVRYARALANEVVEIALDGKARKAMRLPPLRLDYVTCLAQNPADERVIAVATRRRAVYLSSDGGASWRRIAEGEDRGADDESNPARDH